MPYAPIPKPTDDDYWVVVTLTAGTISSIDPDKLQKLAEEEAAAIGAAGNELALASAGRQLTVTGVSDLTGHDPLFVGGVLEAMLLAKGMGIRRARKYARDPSIYAAYQAVGNEIKVKELAIARDVLEAMRAALPLRARLFS